MDFVPGPFAVFRPDVPFKERWELLKPYLDRYYFQEKLKLPKIIQIMKEQYRFDANEPQYKYQFKRWGWKKSIPASKKAQMCDIGQTRANLGKGTVMKYKGQEVDENKLRRYAKMATRKDVVLNPGMSRGRASDEAISDISVATPPEDLALSSQTASSLSKILTEKVAIERAHVFLQGRMNDLIKSMDHGEKELTFTWLNQFWLFGFQTAKNWGRGPRDWTAANLGFSQGRGSAALSLPGTPGMIGESPRALIPNDRQASSVKKPTQLCRWSIHVKEEPYEDFPSPQAEYEQGDPDNEDSWKEWPQSWTGQPFEEKIVSALQSNSFSSLPAGELPFSAAHVASAASKSSNEVLVEAVGFSIIAGNIQLVEKLISQAKSSSVDLSSLYPFHLAISYLDGSKNCCNILDVLHACLPPEIRPWKAPLNAFGHTTIDNLMITVLKNHTSTKPGFIDHALATENRFIGEEVDICGRWNSGSECYRDLLDYGRSSIPFDWKHKFCHTSAQAVCHSLDALVFYGGRTTNTSILETASGLFLRYCADCGQKLQLLPLHTLVLTAFQLARNGCKEEDLFGVLAVLLCLLNHGADPCATAHISISALLDIENKEMCPHEELSPTDLAEHVPEEMTSTWPLPARRGWQLFCLVLRNSHHERSLENLEFAEHGEDRYYEEIKWREIHEVDQLFSANCYFHWEVDIPACFGKSEVLGDIWASIQAELLSYRRLEETDSWTSKYFDMEELLTRLEGGDDISPDYIKQDMLNPYCRCGKYQHCKNTAIREDTAKYYFSNLDDYHRLTAIPLPSRLWDDYFLK
ncbi:hypothetical protein L207DRAFT_548557 [Hyaloscypha variabilis F]|uniref:Clr5 domain-containing protein n=1 Tax=Hyaloscypha variabilis (strain UAMH 11265 / GT02V1 / F) TaxID=1149755 RepID=A0A2J6R0I9_HYAVF|nr:hypothetical protein L207DRAFT_548557 [Hyaloscypha variabilis F]